MKRKQNFQILKKRQRNNPKKPKGLKNLSMVMMPWCFQPMVRDFVRYKRNPHEHENLKPIFGAKIKTKRRRSG